MAATHLEIGYNGHERGSTEAEASRVIAARLPGLFNGHPCLFEESLLRMQIESDLLSCEPFLYEQKSECSLGCQSDMPMSLRLSSESVLDITYENEDIRLRWVEFGQRKAFLTTLHPR